MWLLAAAGSVAFTASAQQTPKVKQKTQVPQSGTATNNVKHAVPGTTVFEQWMSQKSALLKSKPATSKNANAVVTIPVVIHVIHDGDAIGSGENLSSVQIQSQLTVLNQDFRRMANTNGWNDNTVGADTEIEFCLAQRDPNGLATTGIVRYNMGNATGFEIEQLDANVKPNTIWDPAQYLNIWIVNGIYKKISNFMVSQSAYTTYPTASGLEGISAAVDADKDGIVIGSKYFGTAQIFPDGDYADGRNLGRTLTHEVGHFLGLMNIWGDGDCTMDDFCEDTPEAADGNLGCPTEVIDSCPDNLGVDMYQNYMDLTNDACQNIFTQDQKTRMHTVLQNSPRRATLTTSIACQPGITYQNDGSIKIENVAVNPCNNTYDVSISVINAGYQPLTAATVHYQISQVNGNTTTELTSGDYPWTGTLEHLEEQLIELPANPEVTIPVGDYIATLTLTSVNGGADETALNNTSTRNFSIVNPLSAVTEEVYVTVKADQWGEEISWELLDSSGTEVLLKSPAMSDGQVISLSQAVAVNNCYIFNIYDKYGDGICCTEGDGFYAITKANPGNVTSLSQIPADILIKSGGNYGTGESVTFKIIEKTNSTTNVNRQTAKLFPNPAQNTINLEIAQGAALPDGFTVYNSIGQMIDSGSFATNTLTINVAHYTNSVYFIKLSGNASQTLQFIKN